MYEVSHVSSEVQYPDQTTTFYHGDHLGSARLMSSVNGYPVWQATYLPFGYEKNSQSGVNAYKFTGYERDSESGLDYANQRYYFSTIARFMTPDPLGASADIMNPQTWNRYTYVINSPLSYIDPLGLVCYHFNDDGVLEPNYVETESGCADHGGFWSDGDGGTEITVTGGPGGDAGTSWDWDFGSGAWVPSGGGGGGGHANNGFTLGIRAPGQTWTQCMVANANTYSIGGATELTVNVATGTNSNISQETRIVTGNGITGLFFDGPGASDFLTAASHGAGSPLTVGRRTSDIMSLNLAGKGGLPQALGSTGAKGMLNTVGKWLNLGLDEAEKFAVDAGLAGAESINCAIQR
jgi:RHS repeat-associated protein